MTSAEEDILLAKEVKDHQDENALKCLIERHSGIYIDMIRKIGGKSLSLTQIGDMMDDKDYNIYQAAIEYDPEKSKFSTFLATKTRYICLTNKTRNKKNYNFVDFEEASFHIESKDLQPDEESSKKELYGKIELLIDNHEDEKVKTLFKERYFSTKNGRLRPWKFVAPLIGLSIQGCINLHNTSLEKIRKTITNGEIKF